jgi:phosphoribosylformylglycinamidine synthase
MTVKPSIPNTESISLAFPELLEKALRNKPEKVETLLYKSLFYRNLKGKSESLISTCLLDGKSEGDAYNLFLQIVLENIARGLEVTGISINFHVPYPNKKNYQKILTNAIVEISEAAELMAVPVISSDVTFFNPPHGFSFLTLAVNVEKKIDQSIEIKDEGDKICWAILDPAISKSENSNINNFSFKIFKEALSELTNIIGVSCFYSASTICDLIAEYYERTEYSGYINLKALSRLTGISGINKLLANSSKEGFIVKIPNSCIKDSARVMEKWNIKCYELGEVIPNEPCFIEHGVGQKLYVHSDIVEKLKTEYNKLENNQLEKSERTFILPEKTLSEKEISARIIKHPAVASRKWINEQLEQFSGNNNLNINYYTDTPIVFSTDNSIKNLLLSANCQCEINDLHNVLTKLFLQALRKFTAANSDLEKAQLTFLTNSKEITYSTITQISKIVSEISKQLNIEIEVNYSFVNQYSSNGLTLYPLIYCSGTVNNENLFLDFDFKDKGDMIFLIGGIKDSFSNIYMQEIYNRPASVCSLSDINEELKTISVVKELIRRKIIKTVHNVSQHGLYVSLIEECIPGGYGFDITTVEDFRNDVFLFGNEGGRFIVSLSPENEDIFIDIMLDKKYPFTTLGHVTKEELRIDDISFGFITDIKRTYLKTLEEYYKS